VLNNTQINISKILPFVVVYGIAPQYNINASVALIELVNSYRFFVASTANHEDDHFSRTLFSCRWIYVREGHLVQCTGLHISQNTFYQGLVLRVNVGHTHQTSFDLTARNVEQVLVLEQINVHATSLFTSIVAQLLENSEHTWRQILFGCKCIDEC